MTESVAHAARVFPFSPQGAAADTPLPAGPVVLTDLTARRRFGLKGQGSAAWLAAQGVALPAVNRIGRHEGMLVLRLGREDIVVLAEDVPEALDRLTETWRSDAGPRGYSSWRDEGWAWMRLSGPQAEDAMASLCAVDLRVGRFGSDEIAQTRVGAVEAVTFRHGGGFDMLFDIAASAFFARAVAAASRHDAGGITRNEE